jgi:tRNA G18 (ribose-2'-O)-methylase SpoU
MKLVVLAHNIRSTYNVGAILRSCEGFGVSKVIFSGYTPYPQLPSDSRLPHAVSKLTTKIAKTALGAERLVTCEYSSSVARTIQPLKKSGYLVVALEQTKSSLDLPGFTPQASKVALLLGEEVKGVDPELLSLCDQSVEIPMFGQKESFNVAVAAGIALYQLRCLQAG